VPTTGIGRVRRNDGRRLLLFLPAAVLKVAFSAPERQLLGAEARGSAAAMRHPFWGRLAVRVFALAGAGFVSRRFGAVRLEDFDAVAHIVDDRLRACQAHPPHPIARQLAGRLAGVLDPTDRDRLAEAVDGFKLPRSSMHGDLHFFNFVRAGDGFRVIDWEHFDADGSFVYDYLNFNISVDRLNLQRPWPETLASLGADHPAIVRAAEVTGVPPQALHAYYTVLKIDTILARTGGTAALAPAHRRDYLAAIRRALASVGLAAWGDGSLSSILAMCSAI
jgi:hypothetical protein